MKNGLQPTGCNPLILLAEWTSEALGFRNVSVQPTF